MISSGENKWPYAGTAAMIKKNFAMNTTHD